MPCNTLKHRFGARYPLQSTLNYLVNWLRTPRECGFGPVSLKDAATRAATFSLHAPRIV